MNKLIIIEGPDCSGKSTLARHAATQLGGILIHASGAKSLHQSMLDYHKSLLAIAGANIDNHPVIMDRFWPSEFCYGSVLRPGLSDKVYDFPEILNLVGQFNPVYVFCGDNDMVERHAMERDPDHPYTSTQYSLVCGVYDQLEEEMRDTPALPNLHHPGTSPSQMKFVVHHYDMLDHGQAMGTFVDKL